MARSAQGLFWIPRKLEKPTILHDAALESEQTYKYAVVLRSAVAPSMVPRVEGWRMEVCGWGFTVGGPRLEVWMQVGGCPAGGLQEFPRVYGRRCAVGGLVTGRWFARRGFAG